MQTAAFYVAFVERDLWLKTFTVVNIDRANAMIVHDAFAKINMYFILVFMTAYVELQVVIAGVAV